MIGAYKWYWYVIAVLVFVLAVFSFGYRTGVDREHIRGLAAVAKQKSETEQQCLSAQQLTAQVDNDLQTDLGIIRNKLNASLVQGSSCVYVDKTVNSGNTKAASGTQSPRSNGISSGWLRQYAATAEEYRRKVIAFQQLCK